MLEILSKEAGKWNAPKHTYETVRVAEGITAFIASEPDTDVVNGNSVAVIGHDGVLVVDSTNFPSHARQMIAEIKRRQTSRFVSSFIRTGISITFSETASIA